MQKFRFITIVMLLFVATATYAQKRIDVGIGTCFYGDAIGLSINTAFTASLNTWGQMFGSKSEGSSLFTQRFMLGAGNHIDVLPFSFSLYTITIDVITSWHFKLSDIAKDSTFALSMYPYITIGVPINILKGPENSMTISGFITTMGLKLGYAIIPKLEMGLGFEYKINISGMYIGSLGLYGYASYIF